MKMQASTLRAWVVYAFYMLLCFVLQVNWPWGADLGGKPNFLFLFSALTGFFYGSRDGLIIAIVAGLLLDYQFARSLGLGLCLCLAAAFLGAHFLRKRLHSNVLLLTLLNILLVLVEQLTLIMGMSVFSTIQGSGFGLPPIGSYALSVLQKTLIQWLIILPMAAIFSWFRPYSKSKYLLFSKDEEL